MPQTTPFPIFDGHNDTLLKYYYPSRANGASFFERNEQYHIDLPRAREGGFGGGMFAVFIPAPSGRGIKKFDYTQYFTDQGYFEPLPRPLKLTYAQPIAMTVTAGLFKLEAESKGHLKVTRTVQEIEQCLQDGVIAAVLHFEGQKRLTLT